MNRVVVRSYKSRSQNQLEIVKFSLENGKETWKSGFQETKTSGTHRYHIQNIDKTVKFLSLLRQNGEI